MRGRLQHPGDVTWRIEAGEGPVPADTLRRALLAASQAWGADPRVGLRPAADGEEPQVEVSWQRGLGDPCHLFGRGFGPAHTGLLGPGRFFVHLDAGTSWSPGPGRPGEPLEAAVAHELGHVLGLDHSPDPAALMSSDTHATAPAAPDWDGLHSLYGGGTDASGDVLVSSAGDPGVVCALRAVAPPDRVALALFDTDGDGADELLAWRIDPAGLGALVIYRFTPGAGGPELARTVGPMIDLVPPGATTFLRTGADGRRWIVLREGSDVRLRGFDDEGWLRAPSLEEQLGLDLAALLARPGPDILDAVAGGAPPGAAGMDGPRVDELVGDLDGDGRPERVRRLGPAR